MSKPALYIAWPGGMTVVIRNAANRIVGRSKTGPKGTPLFRKQFFRLPDDPQQRLSLTQTIFRNCSPSNQPIPIMMSEGEDGSLRDDVGVAVEKEVIDEKAHAEAKAAGLPPTQQSVVDVLQKFGPLSKENITTLCPEPPLHIGGALKSLTRKGVIQFTAEKYHLV